MKIKHLTLLCIAIGACFLMFSYLFPKVVLFVAEKQHEQGDPQWNQAVIQAINSSTWSAQKWNLIKKYMIETGPHAYGRDYDIYIGPSFSQVRGEIQGFSWLEKESYLQEYLEKAPIDGYLVRVAHQIAYYYSDAGQMDLALQALALGEERLKDSVLHTNQVNELMMARAQLLIDFGEVEQAKSLLTQLEEQLGRNEQYLQNRIAQLTNRYIERNLEKGTSSVSGKVIRNDGTPLPRVGVYLREQKIVRQSVMESDPYQATTDQDGHFKFEGVVPGSYQLFIGVKFEHMDGWSWPVQHDDWIDIQENEQHSRIIEFHPLLELVSPVNEQIITEQSILFQWEKVENAAYYDLNLGIQLSNGSTSMKLRGHITENQLLIPVEELYDAQTGLSFRESDDWSSIDPLTLLAYANPDNLFLWNVVAYDANGSALTRSDGYRLNEQTMGNLPLFYIQERTMTAADKLLLDHQLEEALTAYHQAYENDRNDIHSLRMIIRLLESKALVMDKKEYEEKALPYVIEMIDVNPNEHYLRTLIHYYSERYDWEAYNDHHAELTNIRRDLPNDYEQSIHATALMKQGRLEEAHHLFAEVMQMDNSHRFVGNYLALDLYLNQSFTSTLVLAEQYPERTFTLNNQNWAHLIKQLQRAVDHSSLEMNELVERLEMYFHNADHNAELIEWLKTTKHVELRSFMQALLDIK